MDRPADSQATGSVPPGFELRRTLKGHTDRVNSIVWSPDGRRLISASADQTLKVWDFEDGRLVRTMKGHGDGVSAVAFTPDKRVISASVDQTLKIWDLESGQLVRTLRDHADAIMAVIVLPDGRAISGSYDSTLRIWDLETGMALKTFASHPDKIYIFGIVIAPDGRAITCSSAHRLLAWELDGDLGITSLHGHESVVGTVAMLPDGRAISGSDDSTLIVWDLAEASAVRVLEGHSGNVDAVAASPDGLLVASKSADGTVRLWDCATWQPLVVLEEPSSEEWPVGMAFHPSAPVLATLGDDDTSIRIWDLDYQLMLGERAAPAPSYANAKVVLVGDTGVGKSGLSLVLTGSEFQPTESTHGRHVRILERQEIPGGAMRGGETRETLLWDLAGQPGYRLIHQLHLNEVAVALVVFDARGESDPFAGVRHWDRALRQAVRVQGTAALPLKKFLVVSRTEVGGVGVGQHRID